MVVYPKPVQDAILKSMAALDPRIVINADGSLTVPADSPVINQATVPAGSTEFNVTLSGDSSAPVRPKLNHAYEDYLALRTRSGWDPEHGFMVRSVWENMGDEGRQSAIDQYADMAKRYEAEMASHGLTWGAF